MKEILGRIESKDNFNFVLNESIPSFSHHLRMREAWQHKRFRLEYMMETLRLFVIPFNFCRKGLVLDVGSGVGTRVAALRAMGIEAMGLEIEKRVVEEMTVKEAIGYNKRGNLLNIDDLASLKPYYCISDDVLEHLSINEVSRFLEIAREVGIKEMIHSITTLEHFPDIFNDPTHISKFKAEEWRKILNFCGWRVVGANRKQGRFGVFHLILSN